MRKYLEKEMLCEALQCRVRYDCTTYPGMDGFCVIRVFVDGKEFKRFSHETVNNYFIENGIKQNDKTLSGTMKYWNNYMALLGEYPIESRTEYSDTEFCEALAAYRNQDIKLSIHSENPIVVMFALFDRRTGEQTLEKIRIEIKSKPEWVKKIYALRVNE